ncbi:hypothetical protein EJ03DRAFT_375944 [Teratosphaeria nubilosa]|uniref:Protein kinase domain-containing protein n=1 Tax=Teratosphaeria nubilosa TaxID=161662 RepID=A0A6G1L3Y7_9PEZI|nr:hypothetical protein EJ03DRAFT_375944 [Teratosphaeria nubilosa]
MDTLQKAKSCNYLIRKLGSGEYADAYLSLPKSTTQQATEDYASDRQTKSNIVRTLRANLQVTKMPTQKAADQTDIDREVEVLTYLQSKHRHPNIVELIDTDHTSNERKRWYTMRPVCSGGNIETLCNEDFQGRLTAGLVWHIAYQLVSVLLYLHFGSYEASTDAKADWPFITHGDINPGNMLFHFPSAASPARTGNYPNLVLIDLGKSCFIEKNKAAGTPTKSEQNAHPKPPSTNDTNITDEAQTSRTGDVSNTLYWLTSLEQSIDSDDSVKNSGSESNDSDDEQHDSENEDGPFGRALLELEKLEERRPNEVYVALREFLKLAAVMREKLFEDLEEGMLEFFGADREVVTDQELESVVPVLKE